MCVCHNDKRVPEERCRVRVHMYVTVFSFHSDLWGREALTRLHTSLWPFRISMSMFLVVGLEIDNIYLFWVAPVIESGETVTHRDCILTEKFTIEIIGRTADDCCAVRVAHPSTFNIQTDQDAKSVDVRTVHISTAKEEGGQVRICPTNDPERICKKNGKER